MENYVDADVFLKQIENDANSEEVSKQFQRQFERLVVLDYIIRNTGKIESGLMNEFSTTRRSSHVQ